MLIALFSTVSHATETELWKESKANDSVIEHGDWQTILSEYVVEKKQLGSAYPTNFFRYAEVNQSHKLLLKQYISNMAKIDPRDHSKGEQFASGLTFIML